jgi:acetyl-CoA carboxylase carboxyltransferase component
MTAVTVDGDPGTPREVATVDVAQARIEILFDPGTFLPIRAHVGDGVVAGGGRVRGRPVFAWAQNAAVRGGSLGVRGGETIAHVIRRASASGAPVVGFPHSGGARLQEGAAALSAYSAIFSAQACARVPQISVIVGACAGGAAYSPALGDLTVMAGPDALLFLTGPSVVERVTREKVSGQDLGGARVHSRNGVAHLVAEDDVQGCEMARELPGDPGDVLPPRAAQVYDVRDVVARIVDGGELCELAPRWARNMVVGFARLDGSPVGVIANQPRHLGGTINAEASQKGAWFVSLCDRYGLPLIVLVDTPGFLPGASQERDGVIRHGASLLRAFGRATTARVTVTLRQAYGGAHIVMNSRDLGADHTLAWEGASIGVMGPRQAVELIERRAIAAGADPEQLASAYEQEHLPAERAATAGLVDEIIAPAETRERLLGALEMRCASGSAHAIRAGGVPWPDGPR